MNYGALKEAILERTSIEEVVSRYVSLERSGAHLKGKSPFTQEKTASFFVSPDKNVYYCFSSQQGGDLFTFVEKIEGVDFKGACELLAERVGLQLAEFRHTAGNNTHGARACLEYARDTYRRHLTGEIRQFLHERGLQDASIQAWDIGYAPMAWDTIASVKAYTPQDKVASGLCVQKGGRMHDLFRGRVIFPLCNELGSIVGFSGRVFPHSDRVGKYINSPETPLFHKSRHLYGLDKARATIHRQGVSVIVEGPFDVLLAHQAGIACTVAPSGTAITIEQLKLLRRLAHRVVSAFDGDNAGTAATKRMASIALALGMEVTVASLPPGQDPAELIKHDPAAFAQCIQEAKPLIPFLLVQLQAGDQYERIQQVREHIFPVLASADPMFVDRAMHDIASYCKVSHDAVVKAFASVDRATAPRGIQESRVREVPRAAMRERRMQSIAFAKQFLAEKQHALPDETRQALVELENHVSIPTLDDSAMRVALLQFLVTHPSQEQEPNVVDVLADLAQNVHALLVLIFREELALLTKSSTGIAAQDLAILKKKCDYIRIRLKELTV